MNSIGLLLCYLCVASSQIHVSSVGLVATLGSMFIRLDVVLVKITP